MSEQIKNNLWNLVENSSVYSFKENPLPIFNEFLRHYINISNDSVDVSDSQNWLKFIVQLAKESEKNSTKDIEVFCKSFASALLSEIGEDNKLLAKIVDFFIEKYVELQDNNQLLLTHNLETFIYWYAVGFEACTTELALYNPFAYTCSFGKEHVCGLNDQLKNQLSDSELNCYRDAEYAKSLYKEHSHYVGVESNEIYRMMGLVRLLVNNPTNLDQMFIHSGDSLNESLIGYSGGWTMITIPPVYSDANPTKSDIELVKKIIDQFIEAEGFSYAFLILPKSFCYDNAYQYIRSKIVCRGTLGAVIELPQEAFKTPSDHVLVYLRKSSNICGTKFVDGRTFIEDGKLDVWNLFNVCIDYDDEPSEYCTIIGDYTIAQCDYCLLPTVFVKPNEFDSDNEILNECHSKYQNLIETEAKSEEKRMAHRNISGQLSHMLGTAYHKIFDAISELKYVEGMEQTYSMLYDNFEYMRRLINSIDDDFSSQTMNLEEMPVNEFLQKYCKAWKNYGKKLFSVSFDSKLNDETTFKIDEVFIKVMLDAILENANRHGFNGIDVENPQILISTSYTMVNKIPCVLMSIANNGAPFPDDFTIEQYIREGEFGGTSGNTGRGGYHIYQIAKRHQGYISLGRDNDWNVKVNIMIPIEYYDECETEKITAYDEEYM